MLAQPQQRKASVKRRNQRGRSQLTSVALRLLGNFLKIHPNVSEVVIVRQNLFDVAVLHNRHRGQVSKRDLWFVLKPLA